MGNYVYLEDEEIDYINRAISNKDLEDRMFGPEDIPPSEIYLNIKDKLLQKPKTLEELGYKKVDEDGECDFENDWHEITYMNKENDREAIIFEIVEKEVYFESLSCDRNNRDTIDLKDKPIELFIAIKNKAKELFKE